VGVRIGELAVAVCSQLRLAALLPTTPMWQTAHTGHISRSRHLGTKLTKSPQTDGDRAQPHPDTRE
jgi:hypothetical protein